MLLFVFTKHDKSFLDIFLASDAGTARVVFVAARIAPKESAAGIEASRCKRVHDIA